MNIDMHPESCPQCGINFQEYYDAIKKDFEDLHVLELTTCRKVARHKGIIEGFLFGILVPTILLGLGWKDYQQESLVEYMTSCFSEYSPFILLWYVAFITLFILIKGIGKVNSREEQRMWEQFLQKQRTERTVLLNP